MRIRESPPMCGAQRSGAPDGHRHVCLENKGHRGEHECGVGTDHGTCGHRWQGKRGT